MMEYGPEFVRRTLISNLKHGSVQLPVSLERQLLSPDRADEISEMVTLRELGLFNPTLLLPRTPTEVRVLDPNVILQRQNELRRQMLERGAVGGVIGGPSVSGDFGGSNTLGLDMTVFNNMMRPGTGGPTAPGGRPTGRGPLTQEAILGTLAMEMAEGEILNLRRYDFIVQLIWVPTPPSRRDIARQEALEAAEALAAAMGDMPTGNVAAEPMWE